MNPVILVTGASSGIGLLCAERLAQLGHRVYAASRRGTAPAGCEPLVLNVDRDDSVHHAIEAVLRAERRIDAVVHCAGWGLVGAIEDTSIAEAQAQFETNFFGVHRVTRAVVPEMRRRGAGSIVIVSSLAAYVPLPFEALYAASKAAISSYAESLRLELEPFGVKVVSVEPGNFRTGFTAVRRRAAAWSAPYGARAQAYLGWIEEGERGAPEAHAVAAAIVRAIASSHPPMHQIVTASWFERTGPWLRMLLPQQLYEYLALRVFRLR